MCRLRIILITLAMTRFFNNSRISWQESGLVCDQEPCKCLLVAESCAIHEHTTSSSVHFFNRETRKNSVAWGSAISTPRIHESGGPSEARSMPQSCCRTSNRHHNKHPNTRTHISTPKTKDFCKSAKGKKEEQPQGGCLVCLRGGFVSCSKWSHPCQQP